MPREGEPRKRKKKSRSASKERKHSDAAEILQIK